VLKADASVLQADTLTNQIAWFEAFDAFQREDFVNQLAVEADRLAASQDARQALVGRQVKGAIDRAPSALSCWSANWQGDPPNCARLPQGLGRKVARPPAATRHLCPITWLSMPWPNLWARSADAEDDLDDDIEDEEGEVENQSSLVGRRQIADIFRRAMRARAIGQASGRAPARNTPAGKILLSSPHAGLNCPTCAGVGERLPDPASSQSSGPRAARLAGIVAPLSQVSTRHAHQRAVVCARPLGAQDVQPAELDLIILAILSQAREMTTNAALMARLGDNRPTLLEAAAGIASQPSSGG
jgi:hypothetical protein